MHPQQVLILLISSASLLQSATCTTPSEHETNWTPSEDSWNYWWSYSGVSGPTYWGLLNLDWFMCDKGRLQSPIDISTSLLVYDPHLTPLRADNNLISGLMYNDGHAIVFNCSMPARFMVTKPNSPPNSVLTASVKQSNNDTLLSDTSQSPLAKRGIVNDLEPARQSNGAIIMELGESIDLSISQTSHGSNSFSESLFDKRTSDETALQTDVDSETADSLDFPGANEQNPTQEWPRIQLTGAGLPYSYSFEALFLRFGSDNKSGGSEHTINSLAYVAEIQLVAYNSYLYKSYHEASNRPNGLMAISILVDTLESNNNRSKTGINKSLESLMERLHEVKHRGSGALVRDFNLSALLPESEHFVTYEGSLTTPGCQESVNWLVLNKPLYISQSNLDTLRSISAVEKLSSSTGTLMSNNIRPVQPTNGRPIRTNIKPSSNGEISETCQWTKYEYKQVRKD